MPMWYLNWTEIAMHEDCVIGCTPRWNDVPKISRVLPPLMFFNIQFESVTEMEFWNQFFQRRIG